jgi:TPR repeat protein
MGIGTLYGWDIAIRGVNMTEAGKYWRMAAQRGYLEAEYNLGLSLIEGDTALDGCRYVEVAARGGHAQAQEVMTTKCSEQGEDQ